MTSENTFHTNLIQSYVALTKPKIILMLLFTALGGLFLASSGVPDMTTTLVVLAGGTLASAGANALNQFFDRDIDEAMTRTCNRPVVSGAIRALRGLQNIGPAFDVAFGGIATASSETKKAILLYTILMLALTTMFYTTGAVGLIYLITSFLAGVVFITYAWRLWRQPDILSAKPLYLYSLLYIALIFLGIMLDSLIKI